MATQERINKRTIPATALVNLLLCIGLFLIVFGLLTDKPILAIGAICSPMALYTIGYGFKNPRFTFLLYIFYSYFFIYIMRYLRKDGLSVGLDILLIYMVCTLLLTIVLDRKSNFNIRNAVNGLTICYFIWIIYILFQMLNPGTSLEGMTRGFRILIIGNLTLYVVLSLMTNTPKIFRTFLIFLGILTIISFIKLLYQRFIDFDLGEKYFLYAQEAYRTHMLNTGTRYFSFFSDAGNFGPNMGAIAIIYSITSFFTHNKRLKIYFAIIALMGLIGMFMSGTRSAIAVPFGGLALYCLLCKNIKIFATAAMVGILSFSFLAFTDIGEDNTFIRRMRTAIRPTEDASFNVRQTNKVMIAEHLENKPFGVGIYQKIPKLWSNPDGTYSPGTLPPDSYLVDIWIQHGIVGLIIHLSMYAIMILWGSYLVLFKVKNKALSQILAVFLGVVLGFIINAYAGQSFEQHPTTTIIAILLAFVMNGPYIDKQLSKENNNYIL